MSFYRVIATVNKRVEFVGVYELTASFTRSKAVDRAKRAFRKLNGSTKAAAFSVEVSCRG
jgi:hypothetical protein